MSSKRLVAEMRADGEMCLYTENIRNALLTRQTQEKEGIPRDKRSFHGRHYREPQLALQCLKASCKEEQISN
jgi:hypothetical protein